MQSTVVIGGILRRVNISEGFAVVPIIVKDSGDRFLGISAVYRASTNSGYGLLYHRVGNT